MTVRTALITFLVLITLTHLATRVAMGLQHCLTTPCLGGPQ